MINFGSINSIQCKLYRWGYFCQSLFISIQMTSIIGKVGNGNLKIFKVIFSFKLTSITGSRPDFSHSDNILLCNTTQNFTTKSVGDGEKF